MDKILPYSLGSKVCLNTVTKAILCYNNTPWGELSATPSKKPFHSYKIMLSAFL